MHDIKSTESIRDALLRLYDPPALAAAPLAGMLEGQGVLKPRKKLYDLLLATIERMRPPDGAPTQSHGWRCYRYLQLRYVECASHEAIAQDLGISVRQATRVHQDALQALVDLLLPDARVAAPPSAPTSPQLTPRPGAAERGGRPPASSEFPTDLTIVGRQVPDGMVDVAEVTGSVVDTCRRFAASHGADLRLDIPGRMPPVRVNRVALRQILLNALQCLVRVAHRQSAGHGAPILVQGEQTAQGVTVVLRWENQSGETAGAGTGLVTEEVGLLAVAREIAGLQGASVDEGWDRSGALEVRVHVPAGSVRTVLLVDDNPEMGELFRRMLHKTPYSVVHARTAGRALSLAQENVPDIIILDVVMPTRDGWEILAALQINPTTADIPVLICSVLPDREFALSLGATGFLTKPVIRRALLCALDSLIEAAPTHQSASLS